jgi:Fe-Mn family superoxide dismutase
VQSCPDKAELFNNAGQDWNHNFYWRSLQPGGGGRPRGALGERIAAAFGNYETFRKDFAKAAVIFATENLARADAMAKHPAHA